LRKFPMPMLDIDDAAPHDVEPEWASEL